MMSQKRYSVKTNGNLRLNLRTSEPSISDAIQKGYFQQVRFLIELGYNVNAIDRRGRTPLMSCALVEDESWGVGLARLLLEKGATLQPRDKHGLNALHYACIYDRTRLVATFLKATDFDLNQQDRFGNTALHYSATSGNLDTTQKLVQSLMKYKLTVDVKNSLGVTPLLQAWKNGHTECARKLVELGNADQDVCDPQVNKCSRDYEIDLLVKANTVSEDSLQSSDTGDSHNYNFRPAGGATSRNSRRLYSAPSGGRNSRVTGRSTSSKARSSSARSCDRSIISKEDLSLRLYKDAGKSNPRNIPEIVFKSSPTQCFTYVGHTVNNPKNSGATNNVTVPTLNENVYLGWKSEVKSLLNSYDFQWSDSYRRSIIPPPESSSLSAEEEDELFDLRPFSPCDGDPQRRSHKYTGLKNLRNALGGFGDAFTKRGPGSRRSSILSNGRPPSRRGSISSPASLLLSEPRSATSSDTSLKKKTKQGLSRAWRQDAK